MKVNCILKNIIIISTDSIQDYITLETCKGTFKIKIVNGASSIPILNSNKEYVGLVSLKIENSINIYHKNNICNKITINDKYEFLSSEEYIIGLSDTLI